LSKLWSSIKEIWIKAVLKFQCSVKTSRVLGRRHRTKSEATRLSDPAVFNKF